MILESNLPLNNPESIFYFITSLVVIFCVLAVIVAVIVDFIQFHPRKKTKKENKSIVETGTMFLFFFFFYYLLRFNLGEIAISFSFLKILLMVIGLSLLIIGCLTNIVGRFKLGKNWANQIKIYQDHSLVSTGVYGIIRHPLYASLIWMFFGASLVYNNYYSFLANLFIFIPFMYYRAKQEEKLLKKEFKEYKKYQQNVGMFFPKLFKTTK